MYLNIASKKCSDSTNLDAGRNLFTSNYPFFKLLLVRLSPHADWEFSNVDGLIVDLRDDTADGKFPFRNLFNLALKIQSGSTGIIILTQTNLEPSVPRQHW